jgi:SAM-dependent MidA family methyltransferase
MTTPLERLLRDRIRREGTVSFRDVMQSALYDPTFGYYTNLRSFDDFFTSPEVHPAFGWLIGRQALEVWHALHRPRPFRVLELGGGSGALAENMVAYLRQHVPGLEYVIDELSPALQATQRRRLKGPEFRWTQGAAAHFVIANEVADALPVHRVVVRNRALHELKVGLDEGNELTWVEATSVPPEVAAYFDRLGVRPPERGIAEVSTALHAWTKQLVAGLERGLALVLDYGYPAEQLHGRKQGTLLTYYRHTLGSDPLIRLGEQDISAHVDFSSMAMAAKQAELHVVGVTSQRTLLRKLGIGMLIDSARARIDRGRLSDLVDPHGLGRIGALFLTRGLPEYAPVGLCGGGTWDVDEDAPMLEQTDEFIARWREAFQQAEEAQCDDSAS